MENSDTINISLAVSRRTVLFLLAALFLAWKPGYLGSETLTLTTYYPAPYGGYASLLTTGQTVLARDGGNVGIGTASPTGKLDIVGGGIELDAGVTIHSRGRMHIDGEEILYVLNNNGLRVSTAWGGNGQAVVEGDLYVNGFIRNQCVSVPYTTASGVSFCGGGRTIFQTYGNGVSQVFGYFTDGAGTPIGRLGFGQDWNGTLLCCRMN